MPAAQAVQALLLLVQLGQGQLVLGDLLVDLGQVFATVGHELDPFGLPGDGVHRGQPLAVGWLRRRPEGSATLAVRAWSGGLEPPTCWLQDSGGIVRRVLARAVLAAQVGWSSSQCAPVVRCDAWWNDQRNDRMLSHSPGLHRAGRSLLTWLAQATRRRQRCCPSEAGMLPGPAPVDLHLQREAQERPDEHDQPEDSDVLK